MVNVLISSAVDREFEPRSGQTKDYENGIWLGIRIMCPSGATCLPADCCISELALLKSNSARWSSTKRTSSSSHGKLTCSRHDIAEKLLNWRLTTIAHSITRKISMELVLSLLYSRIAIFWRLHRINTSIVSFAMCLFLAMSFLWWDESIKVTDFVFDVLGIALRRWVAVCW
jgi:hypothetical protein